MLCGAVLVGLTVLLPPEAEGSDAVVAAFGAIAGLAGLFLLWVRHASEAVLGVATALGSVAITIVTWQHGLGGSGAEDNEMLYLWVCLYAFYFLSSPTP